MALLKVLVGDKSFIVDSDNKGTAKAFGRSKIDVQVSDATGDDVTEFVMNGGTIEKLVPAEKKSAEAAVETAAAE